MLMRYETINTKTCNLLGLALVDDIRFVSESSLIKTSGLCVQLCPSLCLCQFLCLSGSGCLSLSLSEVRGC
jgi:hypothetical protein